MLRFFLMSTVSVALLSLSAACGGSSAGEPTPPTPDPTVEGRLLRLSVAEITESDFRGVMEYILANPGVREGRCAAFLAQTDLDAALTFEEANHGINPSTPSLTPVAEDQARAGQIIKETCRGFEDGTLPRATPTPA